MKKILSISLLLFLLLSTAFPSFGADYVYDPVPRDEDNYDIDHGIYADKSFTLGDVNGDAEQNGKDALAIKAAVAGLEGYGLTEGAADFNADGTVDAKDSYLMKTCLAGTNGFSDFENGKQVYKLTVAGRNISEFAIVIPEDTSYDDNLYLAAELLYEYIKDANGADLAIKRARGDGEGAVFLYRVDKASPFGKELGSEGYKYEVRNGDLYIYGTDRGNMYAVYEILEDYLGYGFVNDHWTFSNKKRTVDLEEGLERTFVPGFRFRYSKSSINKNDGYRYRMALPCGVNGIQGYNPAGDSVPITYLGNFVGPLYINIHSLQSYHQMATGKMPDESFGTLCDRYMAKYGSGEFKDETKWEPCATNDQVYDLLFTGLLETLDMVLNGANYPFSYEDGTNCISFSPCDNRNWCTCRYCAKAAREKTYIGVYLELGNRAARDIQDYYPGVKIYNWVYTDYLPTNVLPDSNLIVVLAGFNCANHHLGSGECVGDTFFGTNNFDFEAVIEGWHEMCTETGAEMWLWYYPESQGWWIYDIPNLYNIYYDVTWLYEHGVTGFFYEGNGYCPGYTFEHLKAYMAMKISYDPRMSFEEYDQLIKDYLFMTYGEGWEYIYEFLQMYTEAGDLAGYELGGTEPYCFIGNYNRAFDFVNFEYIAENYEYMRGLILSAIEEFDSEKNPAGTSRTEKLYRLLCVFELLGLGATYVDSYVNADEGSRAVYEERYAWVYEYYDESGMRFFVWRFSGENMPETFNLDTNPFLQFTSASVRPEITEALKG